MAAEKRDLIALAAVPAGMILLAIIRDLIPLPYRMWVGLAVVLLPLTMLMLFRLGLWEVFVCQSPCKAKEWFVYGDLTGFYDRWGKEHTRLVAKSRFYRLARLKAWLWCDAHPHGSAFISGRLLTAQEVNDETT